MWKLIRQKLRYYLQYVPFTINSLLVWGAIWLAWHFLNKPTSKTGKEEELNPDNFQPFILLMAKIALVLVVVIMALSILSTLAAWLHYIWLKKKKGAGLQIHFSTETQKGQNNRIFLNASLEGAFRPLLGFVKGRLFYDNFQITDKFSLLSNKRKEGQFWRFAIGGKSRLSLPDIKEYQIRGGLVFFEDMLHLFSFAVPENSTGQFYQPPLLGPKNEQNSSPKKTETTDIRIEQMRRVEGEHLSYKDFESGDDVRRIVWKVYAKNRDLVVRIPERFEPFASHLYFYASFYSALPETLIGGDLGKEMLNYFKNNVWTVYYTFSAKDFEIRFISDQNVAVQEGLVEKERIGRLISGSTWQTDKGLDSYFNAKQGTVLCISSLTDLRALAQVLEVTDESNLIYFIKLSNTFRQFIPWSWLKRLLFLPPQDRLQKARDRWLFSPVRIKVQKREKEILTLLQKSSATVVTI